MPRRRRSLPRGLYWRGETLYARLQIEGRDIRRCLHTGDVKTARERLKAERERLTAEIRYGSEDRRWENVFVAWSSWLPSSRVKSAATRQRYAMSLKQLGPWLKGRHLAEINKAYVGEIIEARLKAGVSPATIRRDLTALSSVLTFAEARGWHDGNAALTWQRLTSERRDPIVLPAVSDVALVIEGAGGMAAIIRAARATGAREDELVRASRCDLDIGRMALTIIGKGNVRRTIDVGWCWDIFATLPAGIADAALFPSPQGGRWRNIASRFAGITRRIQRHATKAKRPFRRFRFHDLRHLFAVEYLRAGRGSIYDLQQHLGHSSVKVTEMYLAFLTPEEAGLVKAMHSQAQKTDKKIFSTDIIR